MAERINVSGIVTDPAMVDRARRVLEAAVGMTGAPVGTEAVFDVQRALLVLGLAAGMLVDAEPGIQTKRDIRRAAASYEEYVRTVLLALDVIKKSEGRPMLEVLGLAKGGHYRTPDVPLPS